MPRPLSLLDLTQIPSGSTPARAIADSVELAQLAEALGYHRVWYAEHHNTEGLASGSPEILIGHIADHTRDIRVGSGGVMLPNHSPLRIAEAFRLLETIHPGRIDLGLGRAPGTDTLTAFAMRRSREALTADDYPEQLAELLAWDDNSFPADHPFAGIRPVPAQAALPPMWLLGSSDFSARLAGEAGFGFAFAAHINAAGAVSALRDYRNRFVPSARQPEPWAILTVSVTVGEDEEHARDLSLVDQLMLLRLRTARRGEYPTLEEAKAYPFTPQEQAMIAAMPMRSLVGDAASVHRQIDDLAERSGADEVMITTFQAEPAVRRLAVTGLAAAFGLEPRSELGFTPAPLLG